MVDFNALLARKYDIMQQGADTAKLGMVASANLDTVRAGLMPKESAANIGLVNAQTGLAKSNAANIDETTKYVGPLAKASIFNTRAQGSLYGAQATGETQLNAVAPAAFRFRGLGGLSSGLEERIQRILTGGGGGM